MMRVFVRQLYNNFLFITLNEECKNYKLPLSQLVSNTFQLLFLWQKRQEHHKHSVPAETIIIVAVMKKWMSLPLFQCGWLVVVVVLIPQRAYMQCFLSSTEDKSKTSYVGQYS
jgi:peptidoglycan biosynthesis protein MviN/MurJ (putative lipid II flippase)